MWQHMFCVSVMRAVSNFNFLFHSFMELISLRTFLGIARVEK